LNKVVEKMEDLGVIKEDLEKRKERGDETR
jgi:hypothetical protein